MPTCASKRRTNEGRTVRGRGAAPVSFVAAVGGYLPCASSKLSFKARICNIFYNSKRYLRAPSLCTRVLSRRAHHWIYAHFPSLEVRVLGRLSRHCVYQRVP